MNLIQKIDLLTEERISSKAKRTLIGLIKKPGTEKIDVNGFRVSSKPMGDGIQFTFPGDAFEISMVLTDLVDNLGGYQFQSRAGKQMTFTVTPKKI